MCTSVWTLLQGARLEVLRAKFPVHFGHEQHQPVQAQQQIMQPTTMNNMLTNTALTPRHTITGNASGPVGCLGMSAGGSGGGEAKGSGKSAGKAGKGAGSNGGSTELPKFSKETAKSRKRPMLMCSACISEHHVMFMQVGGHWAGRSQRTGDVDAWKGCKGHWGCEAYGRSAGSCKAPGATELPNCMKAPCTCRT